MKIIFAALILVIIAVTLNAQQRPVTIFLAGDSTMAAKTPDKRPETGWGEMLEKHFRTGDVKVDNRAANGRSTVSFISEGRWQGIFDAIAKGDYVFIQFGHNDQKKDKPGVYASPEVFEQNLARFIADAREKGATPVLFTSVARRRFENGLLIRTHGQYPDLVRKVGQDQGVPVIDMETLSSGILSRYGVEDSRKLFLQLKPGENANYPNGVEDNTHFSPLGAEAMASTAVAAVRQLKLPLKELLK